VAVVVDKPSDGREQMKTFINQISLHFEFEQTGTKNNRRRRREEEEERKINLIIFVFFMCRL
jgi:hypothetical protein